jgi:hypothetical protein
MTASLPLRPLMSLVLTGLLLSLAAGPALLPRAAAVADGASPLGINLAAVTDYSDEDPFLDRMKNARGWFGQTATTFDTDETAAIQLDSRGWVTTLTPRAGSGARFTRVATFLMDTGGSQQHNDYAGDYAVRYAGSGSLEYGNATLISRSAGRDVIRIGSAGQVQLRIVSTDPQGSGDYLRNIAVVRLDHEARWLAGEIFDPDWLALQAPFRTLRFLDWMRINGAAERLPFAERPRISDAFYSSAAGVPLEIMTALSNLQDAEPWFTMPTHASDADISAFAARVLATLEAGRRVYVEYSNEVWNTGAAFHPQGSYVDEQAAFWFPTTAAQDWFTARINYHGKRSAEVCQLWRSAFGAQADRVVCVLGAQAANSWTAEEALTCPLWVNHADNPQPGVSCQARGLDAVAIAPYFGSYLGDPDWQTQVRTFSLNRLFSELSTGGEIVDPQPGDWNDPPPAGALAEAHGWMQSYAAQATALGYRLLAYEGGQHLAAIGSAAQDEQLVALFTAANRDPRMGELYAQYLTDWRAAGDLLLHYNLAARSGPYGNWGALEYRDQATAPKYAALAAFAAAQRCDWADCAVTVVPTHQLLVPLAWR